MAEKTIYLVQHGEAIEKKINPLRPLSDKGKDTVGCIGKFLYTKKCNIDVIWHSPKLRAKETAQIIADCMKLENALREYKELEPEEPIKKTLQLLHRADERNVMIVGHLPHLSLLAGALLTGNEQEQIIAFEKGSVLCLDYQDEGICVVRWFITPPLIIPETL